VNLRGRVAANLEDAMQVNPYLNFAGNCAEAFRFYEQLLGGTIVMMQTHGESPMKDHTPKEWHDKVLHVSMNVGSQMLMGSDAPPQHFQTPQGFAVSVTFKDKADSERVFNALAQGGRVTMPFQSTFWSPGFGGTVDRFGTPWMINTEVAAA
jgi:PhnB protein